MQADSPTPGSSRSIARSTVSTYKKARKILGTVKSAWKSAQKPSAMNIARSAVRSEEKLKKLAAKHQQGIASGRITVGKKRTKTSVYNITGN